jgi:hypothetical protein
MNTYCIKRNQFCKGLSKGLIYYIKNGWEKSKEDKDLLATLKKHSTYLKICGIVELFKIDLEF